MTRGSASSIEQAYGLRRAAISAATQNRWEQAKQWFLQARKPARLALTNDMKVMAIGLSADAAVAALHTGDSPQALTLLSEALDELPAIDPVNTLRATFCRRSVHAAVVWTRARVMNQEISAGGQPIRMDPGVCSTPDPPAASEELQAIDIDISWYFLAGAEVAAGVDVGIFSSIADRLTDGAIPAIEVDLRCITMQYSIDRLDTAGFVTHFMRYVESMEYLSRLDASSKAAINPTTPPRGEIPRLDTSCPGSPNSEQVAGEAIIAYRIRAATESRFDIMSELGRAMTSRIKGSFPGKFMFDHCDDGSMLPSGRDQLAVASINALRHTYNQPSVLVIAGLAFLLWIHASNFRHVLMPRLAAWQRDVWSRFVAAQSFRLLRPWENSAAR